MKKANFGRKITVIMGVLYFLILVSTDRQKSDVRTYTIYTGIGET